MKAKEYVAELHRRENEGGFKVALWKMVKEVIGEVEEIVNARGSRADHVVAGVLNEQDQKWRAISRQEPRISEDGFELIVQKEMPQVWEFWQNERRKIRSEGGTR